MSKLLLEDRPLIVLPALACEYGLNEAIILQQLHYWLQESKNVREGHRWVYNTYSDWAKQFPFWSDRTIRRAITKLETEDFVLITGNFNAKKSDKTKWYRIDYKQLKLVSSPSGHNDQSVMTECPVHEDNVDASIPESTSYIASSSSAREESGGVPTTVNEIPHPSPADAIDLIANKFIELRQAGLHLAPMDYTNIQEVLTSGITVENALKWLEECFINYQPRHHRDKIRSFSYCVPYMLDRHTESARANTVKQKGVKAKYSEEDFNLDD